MATFTVTCPGCQGRLVIDAQLEAVVAHHPPPRARSGMDLGDALSALKGQAAKRDEMFREQVKAQQSKSQVLARKFEEGLKKAKDDPDRPVNPMDLD
jgi:hypothetical protein